MIAIAPEHQFVLLADQYGSEEISSLRGELVQVTAKHTVTESAIAAGRRSVLDVLAFSSAARSARLDTLFFPTVYSWFPPPLGMPSVVTIHDTIPEHNLKVAFPDFPQRSFWSLKIWIAKTFATRILTVSEVAKRDIQKYLHVSPGKIDLTCEGASEAFQPRNPAPDAQASLRTRLGIPAARQNLIYVGGFSPHKNLVRLFEAFERVVSQPANADLLLVMVGDPEGGGFLSNYPELRAWIAEHPSMAKHIYFAGYVDDQDLAKLYSSSLALVIPSLIEGFGLPALEAMSCGTPVLAARGGAVMEVAGRAGLYFDPYDVGSMASAIEEVVSDAALVAEMRAATQQEASRNTWEQAAQLTLRSLESSVSPRRRSD